MTEKWTFRNYYASQVMALVEFWNEGDKMKQKGLNREMLRLMYGDDVNLFEKKVPKDER